MKTSMNVLWIRNCKQNCYFGQPTDAVGAGQMPHLHSPDNSTFLCDLTSCQRHVDVANIRS